MSRIFKYMFVLGLVCMYNAGFAQYNEIWHAPSIYNGTGSFVGCQNTDNDPNEEMVFINSFPPNDYIFVIDGVTGVVEWQLSPAWYYIVPGFGQLHDVDNNGRYEILFWGRVTSVDSFRHYLYGYSGGIENEQSQTGGYQELSLAQNYPNPAVSTVNIQYSLTSKDEVRLTIYNVLGQAVRTLIEGIKEPGAYIIQYDCRDEKGAKLPSGTYFYQLETGDKRQTKKLLKIN